LSLSHYVASQGRNPSNERNLQRKLDDRLNSIAPFLTGGMRILEIGCAEGHLGARIKQVADVTYVGLEISADAAAAKERLDHVFQSVSANCHDAPFDLILAFHVLEHIPDVGDELRQWKRLLKPDGHLIVEVPNRSGNPLLERDAHPEHVHQFTPASLAVLLQGASFETRQLSTGHFESPTYPDSMRLIATVARSPEYRREQLRARFLACLGEKFVVYATGGDFLNYVAPLLPVLPITAICDTNPDRHGRSIGGFIIEPYNPSRMQGLPVLIASSPYKGEIASWLKSLGVPEADLHGLDEIYGTGQ
jgi:SAM-dependent methyltransferase